MDRRIITVVAIVAVLVVTITGVRVADPFEQSEEVPEFDFSESPSDIAATALFQTKTTSYTVEAEWNETTNETDGGGDRPSDLVQGTYRINYDHADQRACGRPPTGDRIFVNSFYTWTRESNRSTTSRTANPSGLQVGYFDAASVRECNCVRVKADNESTLVLVIIDTKTALSAQYGPSAANNVGRDAEATLTLVVDKDGRELRKAVFRWARTDDYDVRHVREGVLIYSDWGKTEVERPGWAGYSFEEFLRDFLNVERSA